GGRLRRWAHKLVAGLAVLTAEVAALLGLGLVTGLIPAHDAGAAAAGLIVTGLMGLAWGLAGGATGRTVMGAAATGIGGNLAVLGAAWVGGYPLALALEGEQYTLYGNAGPIVAVVALTTLAGFSLSAWRYGRVEWQRARSRAGRAGAPVTRAGRLLR